MRKVEIILDGGNWSPLLTLRQPGKLEDESSKLKEHTPAPLKRGKPGNRFSLLRDLVSRSRNKSGIIKRWVPESWNELKGKMLMRMVEILHLGNDKYVSEQLAAMALLRLNVFQYFRVSSGFTQLFADKEGNVKTFARMITEFIFKQIELTNNPYPVFRFRFFTKLYGPNNMLGGMTGIEFFHADEHFLAFREKGEEKELNLMLAVLYRPRGKDEMPSLKLWQPRKHNRNSVNFCGDIREDFNVYTFEKRIKQIVRIPLLKRLAIFYFYASVRARWEETYDKVFSGKTADQVKSYGWYSVLKGISASEFGTIAEKELAPVGNLFLSMQTDMENYDRVKV